MSNYSTHSRKPSPDHPYRKRQEVARRKAPGRGEVFQMSIAKASRSVSAWPEYGPQDSCAPSDDLLESFGPSQDRGSFTDWSDYQAEEN